MGKLAQMEAILTKSDDWSIFCQQAKKLRDISPPGSAYYTGVCGCSSFTRALNGREPTDVDLRYAPVWRKRAADKIHWIEAGKPIEEFRIQVKRRKDTKKPAVPAMTEKELCKALFDSIMEALAPCLAAHAIRSQAMNDENLNRLEVAKAIVVLHPDIDAD